MNKAWSHGAFLAVKDFYKLETRQTIAFSEAILGHNVFITGGAGVGKSYTTKTITQVLRKSFGDDAVAVAAPTGAAATVVGGITLCRLINARKQPCDDLVHSGVGLRAHEDAAPAHHRVPLLGARPIETTGDATEQIAPARTPAATVFAPRCRT